MLTFFQIIQAISGVLVVLLILLHSPKGDGMAAIGGASQLFSSQQGAEAGLNKVTTTLCIIFAVSSVLLSFGLIK